MKPFSVSQPSEQDKGDDSLDRLRDMITKAAMGSELEGQSELDLMQHRLVLYVDQRVNDAVANRVIMGRIENLFALIRAHQTTDLRLEAKQYRDLLTRIRDEQPDIYKIDDDEDLTGFDPGLLGPDVLD
jgi:hypothetical protein